MPLIIKEVVKISAIEIIHEQNPWWDDPNIIDNDEYVKRYTKSKFPWFPEFLEKLRFEPSIYSVRGPRRIGKTTLIKYIIKQLIDKGIEPRDIIYASCDSLTSWTELRDILRIYAGKPRKKYIFIDEASFILEWSRAIKYTFDVGFLRDDFVLITGSHAMDILRGVERLPGRRGQGVDFVLLPATFGEFVRTIDNKFYLRIISSDDPVYEMYSNLSTLRSLFEKYLLAGGFPKAQHEVMEAGRVSHNFMMEFITYLKGDALKEKLDVNALLLSARRILETLTIPVSWRTLSNRTGYHHEKIKEHIEFLRMAFAVDYIYPPRQTKNGPIPDTNKNRKIYPLDPFITYTFHSWIYGTENHTKIVERWLRTPEKRGQLIESIILRHLIQWTSNNIFSEEIRRNIFYISTGKREIDFFAVRNNIALAIESKERKRTAYHIALANYIAPDKRTIKIMTTIDEIKKEKNYIKIPTPILLILLSINKIDKIEKTQILDT